MPRRRKPSERDCKLTTLVRVRKGYPCEIKLAVYADTFYVKDEAVFLECITTCAMLSGSITVRGGALLSDFEWDGMGVRIRRIENRAWYLWHFLKQ
jgi:hypothetical protein